ncbi:MAG: polysaccharide deacetylase family sporulation protein PdaB [Bacilli bacterium]|nr:polysaccharide deacetylase family sporulation protein PdaB [Bacilli bacterium]
MLAVILTSCLLPHTFAYAKPATTATTATAPRASAIYQVKTDRKVVALTFDISWGEKTPGPVLDVLADKGLKKATFFLSSPWTKQHPEIAQRIKTMGFEIGTHGHKHDNFSQHDDAWIRDQVQKSHDILKEVTGVETNLIRTPNGDFNPRVLQTLNGMGYQVIQWKTDSLDWKNPGVDTIIHRVVGRAVPGDIILMHASDSCKQTVDALPRVIDGLRAKGYEFLTVSELLSLASVQTKQE